MTGAATSQQKTKKILMLAGGGCLLLITLCCLTGTGLYLYKQADYERGGVAFAELFLGHLQARSWERALRDTTALGDLGMHDVATFQQCFEATVLGDLTSYSCGEASGAFVSDEGVDVECTVTSAAHGQSEVTVHVGSPDRLPYLGFVWFPASAWTGPAWHGDGCTSWSGREYFRDPPPGRVRP